MTPAQERALEDLVRAHRLVRSWLTHPVGAIGDPGPGDAWSVAEHALHIILSFEALERGFSRRGLLRSTRSVSFARVSVLTTWRIPDGATAPGPVMPQVILPHRDLKNRLDEAKQGLVPCLRAMNGATSGLFLDHPGLGPMNRGEWFRFLLVHAHHHDRVLRTRGQIVR